MAVYADYIDLRIAVSELVGNREISDVFARLVQQAEKKLSQKLRTRKQLTSYSLTFASGVAALPADYVEMHEVYDASGYPVRQGGGTWKVDGSNIYIRDKSGAVAISYYASIPTITGSLTASNWLLEAYPDVYLYAAALEAARFLRDEALEAKIGKLAGHAMQALMIDDERYRYGHQTVRVVGVNP